MDTELIKGGWFYLPYGVMRHFRPYWGEELLSGSICDIEPPDVTDWRGNGSKEEAEYMLGLPYCRLCATILGGGR